MQQTSQRSQTSRLSLNIRSAASGHYQCCSIDGRECRQIISSQVLPGSLAASFSNSASQRQPTSLPTPLFRATRTRLPSVGRQRSSKSTFCYHLLPRGAGCVSSRGIRRSKNHRRSTYTRPNVEFCPPLIGNAANAQSPGERYIFAQWKSWAMARPSPASPKLLPCVCEGLGRLSPSQVKLASAS